MIFRRAPGPFADGDLTYYAADGIEESLRGAPVGAATPRVLLSGDTPPDDKELRAAERQIRGLYAGRARRAMGWGLWWLIGSPAIALAWSNLLAGTGAVFGWLPFVGEALSSLGAASGGVVLAAVVVLAPLVWGWARGVADLRQARGWRALARRVERRPRAEPLPGSTDPALSAFATETAPVLAKLRESLSSLGDRGADGVGDGASQARQISLAAARHGLPDISDAYHGIYERLAAAEGRVGRGDSGVLSERRARTEGSRALRDVRRLVGPFRPGFRPPANLLAPAVGAIAGMLALTLTLAVTGLYVVPDGEVLFVEGAAQRLMRITGADTAAPPRPISVVRGPSSGWAAPFPISARRSVSLAPRTLSIYSRLRPVGDDAYDIVEVQITYRIVDVDRWAAIDADAGGERRVMVAFSQRLDEFIGERRQETAQQVATQNPALVNNPDQVFARADQEVARQLEAYVQFFVTQAAPQLGQGAGIQVAPTFLLQPRQGVDARMVEAILGQE